MSIKHRKGNLFDAPKGSILVHACNAQGVWGSGIAKEFKKRYPKSFNEYNKYCHQAKRSGFALVTTELVGCLITSENYGGQVDSPELILKNTSKAVTRLVSELYFRVPDPKITIHSNKFNSGLFNVPWENTEAVIQDVLSGGGLKAVEWIVWEP